MTQPAHAQPVPELTDRRRDLIKRAADLCRARPGVWSAMVRYNDALQRLGMPVDEALEQALTAHAPASR